MCVFFLPLLFSLVLLQINILDSNQRNFNKKLRSFFSNFCWRKMNFFAKFKTPTIALDLIDLDLSDNTCSFPCYYYFFNWSMFFNFWCIHILNSCDYSIWSFILLNVRLLNVYNLKGMDHERKRSNRFSTIVLVTFRARSFES